MLNGVLVIFMFVSTWALLVWGIAKVIRWFLD